MKPYQAIPIVECGEPLVPIPLNVFAAQQPHPYVKLAAPYGARSPYFLREGVLHSLMTAQAQLQEWYPGWRIQIFDAYRPIAVQQFMVDHTFQETVRTCGLEPDQLTTAQRSEILDRVYQFWAVPSNNPATPPPHSTGAAIDITLVDAVGIPIDMGSPIDELSERSYPNHFAAAQWAKAEPHCTIEAAQRSYFDHNRQILYRIMTAAGFQQHPNEWWHFSQGDQMWVWLVQQESLDKASVARYGMV
ncbi:D-alanyl-D-alanine dipeptidase [Oculatella sp. LEGE 06141]|uniref:M15 family metallopeptidase n=1 Tax=Oculatella sp. LEGE 06141 TaxID=1828648 RepID=UPI00188253D6|nr:M15 family metallopeptidase [Oculatella sp. LEGE 06141]MBE9177368.1 D-alanyl-D-alanine dipeptidase [Oculatella sp. LEGE 06141]